MLAYKFRLYPNKEEELALLKALEGCRLAYNKFLEAYNAGERDRIKLQNKLPYWKKEIPLLKEVYSKASQYEVHRLFYNLKSQNEMRKRGRKVGKLRFKSKTQFKSFTYNQSGFKIIPKTDNLSVLSLSKVGEIPICIHRPIEYGIKQISIKHMPSGKWYAFLIVDNGTPSKINTIESAVGIDVGIEKYIVDSDGNEVDNPRHLKHQLKKLRREQRRLSRKKNGSHNREKQRIKVARLHEKVANQRNDFQHKLSKYYIDNYDMIVTERLDISNMVLNKNLSRYIGVASWNAFNEKLAYKAENAGKLFIQIRPDYTSIGCSNCGEMVYKKLSDRRHECPTCGFASSRDYNASLNILKRGIDKVRSERPELTLVDNESLHRFLQIDASSLVEARSSIVHLNG
jgi:putative transposase